MASIVWTSPEHAFSIQLQVRNYELDMYHVVNNARYLNYYEHCRHEWLQSLGKSSRCFLDEGYSWVVRRMEVDYLHALRSGDCFHVLAWLQELHGARMMICQQIRKVDTDDIDTHAIISQALVTAVLLDKNQHLVRLEKEFSSFFPK